MTKQQKHEESGCTDYLQHNADSCPRKFMTVSEFRREVKAGWPYVTINIRTVGFSDLARASAKSLTVSGDKRGDLQHINALAKQAGILPDGNCRCFPVEGGAR